jgi:serine/threonine-protein kinase
MPEVKPWSGQEVALAEGPLEGDGGAVPSRASTPAPVARATLPEDTPVKTSRQDSSPPQKPQRKQGPGRNAVATALCTAAVGASAGCTGAQVRDTPRPEACPTGSQETMQRLDIRTGDYAGAKFPGVTYEDFVTVRESPSARLVLRESFGQLVVGTVLSGGLLFGKERVYGRFTEARTPGGDTYAVCLEAWGFGKKRGSVERGLLVIEADGGPDTAKVMAGPRVKAVERFE